MAKSPITLCCSELPFIKYSFYYFGGIQAWETSDRILHSTTVPPLTHTPESLICGLLTILECTACPNFLSHHLFSHFAGCQVFLEWALLTPYTLYPPALPGPGMTAHIPLGLFSAVIFGRRWESPVHSRQASNVKRSVWIWIPPCSSL